MRFAIPLIALLLLGATACTEISGDCPRVMSKGELNSIRRAAVPPNEDEALYPVQLNHSWGYINGAGEIAIEPRFQEAGEFSEGLAAVAEGGRFGYIDRSGEFVIEPAFELARPFSCGAAAVRLDDQWALIGRDGGYILGFDDSSKRTFSEDLAWVRSPDGEQRFIDTAGNTVFKLDFPEGTVVDDFHDGLAAFTLNELTGFIDKTGRVVIPAEMHCRERRFSEGLAAMYRPDQKGAYVVIDRTGGIVFESEHHPESVFHDGLVLAMDGGGGHDLGFLNRKGEWAVKPRYDSATDFSEGRAHAWRDGRAFIIDTEGLEIRTALPDHDYDIQSFNISYRCRAGDFRHGLARVTFAPFGAVIDTQGRVLERFDEIPVSCGSNAAHDELYCWRDRVLLHKSGADKKFIVEHWAQDRPARLGVFHEGFTPAWIYDEGEYSPRTGRGFLRSNGRTFVQCAYDEASYFSEGLIPIRRGELWGFADRKGRVPVAPFWDEVGQFKQGLAPVKLRDEWHFINRRGDTVISGDYDWLDCFSEGLAMFGRAGRTGFVDRHGREWIEPIYEEAKAFSEGAAAVKSGGKWGYIDKRGRWLIEPQYDQAFPVTEGLALVGVCPPDQYVDGKPDWSFHRWLPEDQTIHLSGTLFGHEPGAFRFIDRRGETVLSEKDYCFGGTFSDGRAAVARRSEAVRGYRIGWDYIDREGNLITDRGFLKASRFEDGKAWVIFDWSEGYIDAKGRFVWGPTY